MIWAPSQKIHCLYFCTSVLLNAKVITVLIHIYINGKMTNYHNYFGIKNGQAMSSHDFDFTFAANLGRVDSIVSRLSSMCRLPIMMSPTALRAHVSRCHLWHSCRSIYLTPLEGTYSHEAKLQVSAAQRCENTDNLVTFIVPGTFCLH